MTLPHVTEHALSADLLTLTAFAPSASRVGRGTATAAVCRFYEAHRPLAATMMLSSEGFGRSRRVHSNRTEALSLSMPIAVTVVDRPSRMIWWLRSLATVLPDRLVLVRSLGPAARVDQNPAAVKQLLILVDPRRPGSCATLIDRLHTQGLWAAWAFPEVTPRRWWETFRAFPVTVVGEQRQLARALNSDTLAVCGERTLVGASASCDGATAAARLGCSLDPWVSITFASPHHTCGGASRHHRVIRALRIAGAAGATTFAASHGYVGPTRPQRPRRVSIGRHTPIVTTIAAEAQEVELCRSILLEFATAQDLITCEPVCRVVLPHE